jgi:hypothetical protein
MNPKSHRIEASLLSVIENVPEGSDHNFGDFFMAVHESIDSVKNVESFDRMKGIFTPKIIQKVLFD